MHKKLTITIDEKVYKGLHKKVGRGNISQFIEELVRPYISKKSLMTAYKKMAKDEERESEALEWSEATIGDVGDEAK
ncbi:MAG: hypothetical protein SCARUB_00347 [Candidatus Scalindua rubra]|uniref:Addiction module antitoxin n=1 Tax=Candidatus Scalindua rubra TaxID=1872076 RepID=A0A1E3XFR2_9BACT|nr:MAG: hypothetical protein SCARUB_00347 [Candidatus Scalindua rubra]